MIIINIIIKCLYYYYYNDILDCQLWIHDFVMGKIVNMKSDYTFRINMKIFKCNIYFISIAPRKAFERPTTDHRFGATLVCGVSIHIDGSCHVMFFFVNVFFVWYWMILFFLLKNRPSNNITTFCYLTRGGMCNCVC